MDHAVLVRVCQRVGNLNSISHDAFGRSPLGWDEVGEPLPFDVFHHDVGLAIVGAHLVNRADMWMIQLRCVLCFAPQPRIRVPGDPDLQRDVAPELDVARDVHFSHPTGPDEPADLIVTEGLTC